MTLTDLCKEVLKLDEMATKGPWNEMTNELSVERRGVLNPIRRANDFVLVSVYRTSAPKLARVCQFYMRVIDALSKEKGTNVDPARLQYIEDEIEKIMGEK